MISGDHLDAYPRRVASLHGPDRLLTRGIDHLLQTKKDHAARHILVTQRRFPLIDLQPGKGQDP